MSARVLLVDDVPEVLEFALRLVGELRGVAVEADATTDPAEALRRARTQTYDLVVSDYHMAGIDGIEILAAAAHRSPAGIRALMTGYREIPVDLARLREARIDAYLQKPMHAHDMLLFLGDALAADPATSLAPWRKAAREIEASQAAVVAE